MYVAQSWINEIIIMVVVAVGVIGAFFGFLIYKAIRAVRVRPYITEVPSEYGKAIDHITPDSEGYVLVGGELWRAISREEINPGERIKVVGKSKGLLIVERLKEDDLHKT